LAGGSEEARLASSSQHAQVCSHPPSPPLPCKRAAFHHVRPPDVRDLPRCRCACLARSDEMHAACTARQSTCDGTTQSCNAPSAARRAGRTLTATSSTVASPMPTLFQPQPQPPPHPTPSSPQNSLATACGGIRMPRRSLMRAMRSTVRQPRTSWLTKYAPTRHRATPRRRRDPPINRRLPRTGGSVTCEMKRKVKWRHSSIVT
jgi:hypothetical protein